MRVGNFELTGEHYLWVDEAQIAAEERPPWALVVERQEWGRFYGEPVGFLIAGAPAAAGPDEAWRLYQKHHDEVRDRWNLRRRIETKDVGAVNRQVEQARLELRDAERASGTGSAPHEAAKQRFAAVEARGDAGVRAPALGDPGAEQGERRSTSSCSRTGDGKEKAIALADIVRAFPANRPLLRRHARGSTSTAGGSSSLDEPREANSEGGVFPAIFGTVIMTLVMSLVVVPFGVMAALYLREYARAGAVVSAVRIAINNLAGVPSIVFGVFGLGFFCYFIGASHRPAVLRREPAEPDLRQGRPALGLADARAADAPGRDRRDRGGALGGAELAARGLLRLRREQVADDPPHRPAARDARHHDRHDPRDGPRRGRGRAADAGRRGQARPRAAPRRGRPPSSTPSAASCTSGFHIYDLGFQSQNREAAKPMVFTTTLLLIGVVFLLNVLAVRLRTRLRRRFESEKF